MLSLSSLSPPRTLVVVAVAVVAIAVVAVVAIAVVAVVTIAVVIAVAIAAAVAGVTVALLLPTTQRNEFVMSVLDPYGT